MRVAGIVLVLSLFSFSSAQGKIPPGGFKNCKQANAAGYWDIKKGSPAYHTRLDRDRDGLACERKKR